MGCLKTPGDAWLIYGNRAFTTAGCYSLMPNGELHLKLRRKKDGKIFEQAANLQDGSWQKIE